MKSLVVWHNNLQFKVSLKNFQIKLVPEYIMWSSAAIFIDLDSGSTYSRS